MRQEAQDYGVERPTEEQSKKFGTLAEAKSYSQWKKEVPPYFRNMVEGHLLNKKITVSKEINPLLGQFLSATATLLQNPIAMPDLFNVDPRVVNQIKKLQKVDLDERSFVNIFEILRNPEISFAQKLQWYKAEVAARLQWLSSQDLEASEETIILVPEDQDELVPSMDEMEKSNEELKEGFYEVTPFYGGYYRGHVYERWDSSTLSWKKDQKTLTTASRIPLVEGTVRSMHGKFQLNRAQAVDLPYGFGIDPQALNLPDGYKAEVFQDQDGIWYVKVESEEAEAQNEIESELKIGKMKNALQLREKGKEYQTALALLPSELQPKINEARTSSISSIAKARILCRAVRKHLEYSNDSSCNDLYRHNPSQYFHAIWQNKKADRKVANTFAAEVLRQANIKVRMVAGHYVKSPSKAGSAILHGGTGHAWLEVFNDEN